MDPLWDFVHSPALRIHSVAQWYEAYVGVPCRVVLLQAAIKRFQKGGVQDIISPYDLDDYFPADYTVIDRVIDIKVRAPFQACQAFDTPFRQPVVACIPFVDDQAGTLTRKRWLWWCPCLDC